MVFSEGTDSDLYTFHSGSLLTQNYIGPTIVPLFMARYMRVLRIIASSYEDVGEAYIGSSLQRTKQAISIVLKHWGRKLMSRDPFVFWY